MRCAGCHKDVDDTHSHHVVPRSLGGVDHPSNLIDLCEACHGLVHETRFTNHTNLVRIGIANARANGKKWGPKPGEQRALGHRKDYSSTLDPHVLALIYEGRSRGDSTYKIALDLRDLGYNHNQSWVQRVCKRLGIAKGSNDLDGAA